MIKLKGDECLIFIDFGKILRVIILYEMLIIMMFFCIIIMFGLIFCLFIRIFCVIFLKVIIVMKFCGYLFGIIILYWGL